MGLAESLQALDQEYAKLVSEKKAREIKAKNAQNSVHETFSKVLQDAKVKGVRVGGYSIQSAKATINLNDRNLEVPFSIIYKAIVINPDIDVYKEVENAILNSYKTSMGLPF